jgi:aspartyl-tRNA(Asn)/glutamyl-tRNA(Gln) amidotransferase subunit A
MNPFSTLKEIIEKRTAGLISEREITEFYLQRIAKYNPELNAIVELFDAKKNPNLVPEDGVLSGIPGLLKDNICIAGQIAAAGSKILQNHRAVYNSTVFSRLKSSGAVVVGRSNCDEFAMGSTSEYSAYGPTKNPWDKTRVPGGSSSGSAAAVAAGMVPWTLGSETGGSVRQPAAFTGLAGIYPTYGLVSRYGLIAFGSSLDQIGPIARTAYDCAILLSIIAGHDAEDSSSLPEPKRDYTRNLDGDLPEGLKIGVIREAVESEGVDAQIKSKFVDALRELENLGAQIKYIDLPNLKYAISVYFIVSRAEAASNLNRIDGSILGKRIDAANIEEMYAKTRAAGFGPEVKRRILMGNYVLSSSHRNFYEQASHVRAMIRAEFESSFKDVNVLASPTTSSLPFKLGAAFADPLQIYMADYFTVPNCVAGLPAISVPCGYSKENLPIGIQFIGPRLSEEILFQVAHAYEKSIELEIGLPQGFSE